MKKFYKLLSVLICVVMVFATLTLANVITVSALKEGNYTYTVSNSEATITGCDENIDDVVIIPTTLGGYPVTKISDNVFVAFPKIEKVYYCGTDEEWNSILKGSGNENLTNAKRFRHHYEWSIILEYPTCSAEGEELLYCSICGYDEIVPIEIDKNAHEYSVDFTVDKQPTFLEDGSKSRHCTSCEAVTDVTSIPNKSYLLNSEYLITVKKSLFIFNEYNLNYDINSDGIVNILDLIKLKNILLES